MSECTIQRVAAIDYRLGVYDWVFARDEAGRIDAHWDAVRREKPGLFDGRVLIANAFAIDPSAGGLLRATGFETNYKPFLGWRDFGFPGPPVYNLFAMGALRAADGAFMLGRMAANTASAGRLYFPAGTPEPSDARDGIVDLDGNMLRELAEETGLVASDVAPDEGWTLVLDGPRLACMRGLRSTLTANEMIARFETFRATESDPELDALVAVRSPRDFDESRMPAFMLAYLADAFAAF